MIVRTYPFHVLCNSLTLKLPQITPLSRNIEIFLGLQTLLPQVSPPLHHPHQLERFFLNFRFGCLKSLFSLRHLPWISYSVTSNHPPPPTFSPLELKLLVENFNNIAETSLHKLVCCVRVHREKGTLLRNL